MDCSIPGPSVLHYLLEFAQIHVLCQRYYLTILSSTALFSFWLQSFPASGYFPMSQFFPLGGQRFGASASTSVLLKNTQDWFPLRKTDLISLQSKGLSYHIWNESPVQVRCMILDFWGWCTGMTQRDGMRREVGGCFRMVNTCTPMADSCQCMGKTTTVL